MEEEPDLPPRDATKKAMAQITGPIIAISLVLLSVFVPIAFIPGISGTAVPPVRRHDQRGDADLGDQRADAVAGAVRRVPAPSRPPARRRWGWCCAASTGCATAMPRSCAGCCASPCCRSCWSLIAGGGMYRLLAAARRRLPAGGGPGRVLRHRAVARRRLGRAHPRGDAAGRGPAPADAAGRATCCRSSASRCSTAATQPNAAFMVVQLKPFADRTAAADSAQAVIGRVFGAVQQIRSANASSRSTCRRSSAFRPAAASSTSSRTWRAAIPPRWRSVDAGPDRRRQPGPAADPRVLDLHRHQSVDLSRHRPRQGAGARASTSPTCSPRCRRRSAAIYVNDFNLYGRTWQVNIAGRGAPTAATSRRSDADLRAQQARARWCRCARSPSLRIVLGPQVISRYNNYRSVTINGSPAPGVSSGDALAAMAQISRQDAAAGLRLRMDRHRLSGDAGDRPDRRASWRWPCCSPICSWWRCTKAGSSRSRCCCRSPSACSGAFVGLHAVRACRSISTRRSAWSC